MSGKEAKPSDTTLRLQLRYMCQYFVNHLQRFMPIAESFEVAHRRR